MAHSRERFEQSGKDAETGGVPVCRGMLRVASTIFIRILPEAFQMPFPRPKSRRVRSVSSQRHSTTANKTWTGRADSNRRGDSFQISDLGSW